MRYFFTDGMNSFWHVAFGGMAVWIWWIVPIFVLYQLMDPFEKNVLVDLGEFFVGYCGAFVVKKPLSKQRWISIYS